MTRGRRRGLGYAAVALLALAFSGAGCTPAPKGVLAVERLEGGGARLLLAGCPGYLARDFSVIADTGDDGEAAAWSVHNGGWTAGVRDIRVFQDPPEGWVSTGGTLTELRKGVPYVAGVNGGVRNRGLNGRVPFTAEDLAALEPGEVLTWAGGEKNTTTARDVFLHGDLVRCEP
ncbi:hypothetical protein [Sphaerisporangium corydalis]|uniref:Uncharacterized protein n=1 Tax=Sphaerisporangium corydalis TaxID=1441875 RepID=A0ABV9ESE3_9ACTN|nr:hypothetical protein [Sphaerisporangium corydalis]